MEFLYFILYVQICHILKLEVLNHTLYDQMTNYDPTNILGIT